MRLCVSNGTHIGQTARLVCILPVTEENRYCVASDAAGARRAAPLAKEGRAICVAASHVGEGVRGNPWDDKEERSRRQSTES